MPSEKLATLLQVDCGPSYADWSLVVHRSVVRHFPLGNSLRPYYTMRLLYLALGIKANANNSTYIRLFFFFKIKYFGGQIEIVCIFFFKYVLARCS